MMTIEALEAARYKKFKMGVSRYDLFMYSKCSEDKIGKKYHIFIDVFDSYPHQKMGTYNFQPEVQFRDREDTAPTVNMTYLGKSPNGYTLEEIEDFFDRAWLFMDKPYYERFDYEADE